MSEVVPCTKDRRWHAGSDAQSPEIIDEKGPKKVPQIDLQAQLAVGVEAAATLLGIGRNGVYRAIREKLLVAKKFGNRTLITTESIRSFLDNLPSA